MKPSSLSLTQRKEALLAKNAALRREISQNLDEIEGGMRHLLGWIESGVQAGQKLKTGGTWLAGLGGLLLGWRLLRGRKKPAPSASHRPAPERHSFLDNLIAGSFRTAGLVGTAVKLWRHWSSVQHHFQQPRQQEGEERGEGHHGVTPRFKT